MSKLSPKTHWDYVHVVEQERIRTETLSHRGTRLFKRLAGDSVIERISAYDEYLLWESIFPRYLESMTGHKVVEVGSAPGEFLVRFSRKHGCTPYGVEYSEVGVQVNREVFGRNGFDPDNVIHADFFSDDFRSRHFERFDAVISKGFIEHFTDVPEVIDRHMDLLAPGGYLIVMIPNLRGFNYPLIRFFDKSAIPRHNIEVMRENAFASLFDRPDLRRLFCDYYGTFSFYLFTAGGSAISRHALKASHKVQPLLNLAFRTLFGKKGMESGMFSPYLLYIGRKVR